MDRSQQFSTTIVDAGRGNVFIAVPFDPDQAWGTKSRHHVAGTIGGHDFRGTVEPHGEGLGVVLGPSWCRDRSVSAGHQAEVVMYPEGLQRGDLAPDVAAALEADPAAGAFFDSLAQFYRTGYIKWVEATKRRPDVRAARIGEMVALLRDGKKQRPTA